jgi:hypothetical protein
VDHDDTTFVDIVFNLLGVFMLMAMLGLILGNATSSLNSSGEDRARAELDFRAPVSHGTRRPLSTYYVIAAEGVFALDLEPYARKLIDEPHRFRGAVTIDVDGETVPLGSYEVEDERRFHREDPRYFASSAKMNERDIDVYHLSVRPHIETLARIARLDGDADGQAETISASVQREKRVASFLVREGGVARFGDLMEAMWRRRVPLRWEIFPDNTPFVVSRDPRQFRRYDYRS